jgi:PAS domain S-box-containing protein
MFSKEPQSLEKCGGKSTAKKDFHPALLFGGGLLVCAEVLQSGTMTQTLHILHLEDNPADSQLVSAQLAAEGLPAEIKLVSNRADFEQQLNEGKWDLVLADYKLPNFNGLDALKIVREKFPAMPFILMSGTIGELAAIESLKAGATDYVLKQNRERLPSAIRRAVTEAAERVRREQAEADLRLSERQYRLLFQGNPHPMWVFDLEKLSILEVNEAALWFYGFSREEFLGMTLADLRVATRDRHDNNTLWDTESQGVVWRHRRKNGLAVDMEVIWTPLAYHGRLAALAMATDVTARRHTAHRNAVFGKLSHKLSAVTIASSAAMFICEAADELFHWDDFALDLYAAEKDEVFSLLTITTIEGQRVEIPSSAQPKTANALVRRVIARGAELISATETGDKAGTTMIAPIRKGESVIGVLFVQSRQSGSYSENDLHTLQTLADQCSGALERVRAEEELRQSQRRFRELFENSPDAIFVEDMQGNVLDANQCACRLHGLTREQLVGKNAIEALVPPERREQARAEFHRLAAGTLTTFESESIRTDGRVIPVEIRVVRIQFENSPALLFHVRDITERRAAEMALRSSETLFRSVWENSVDGMRLTDQQGAIVAVNEAYTRLVGLPAQKLEGKPFTVVYDASADWEKMLQKHRENFFSGRPPTKRIKDYILHDQRLVSLEITDTYVESGGKPRLLLSLFRDVSEQKRLEDQLRQSQKMEAIGRLTGGIAHDFNNILTIILGHASLLAMQNLDAKAQVSAHQIKQASVRAAGLTRQLLAFGRKQVASPKALDLNKLVNGMSEMLTRLLGEDVALQINLSSEPAHIEADQSMIEQVLLNLSVNSRDAMPKGGQLNIRLHVCEVDEKRASQVVDARAGRYVCLSHHDTGCGIPQENLARIFEPFFTTKELGKGTGLGLATVFGIVKQHHGWIEVESQLNQGTTFRVFLPATHLPVAEAEVSDTQMRPRGGSETILVVEDERDLRDYVTRELRRIGYRVFEAIDGVSAFKVWEEYKDQIDLVFSDVIMPGGMNGRELGEKIWAERPQTKIIFSSGYGADTLGKDFRLDPHINYLQKPYLPHQLAKAIRNCLDDKKI